jgi:hypothetical protein
VTGTIQWIDPSGASGELAAGLDDPWGLALDATGRPLIVERGAGRVLRREASGALTVVADGLKQPEWIALADDGTVCVTVEGREVLAITGGSLIQIAHGLDHVGGLVWTPAGLVAAAKHDVLRLVGDGTVTPLHGGLKHGSGAAIDALAALYVAGKEIDDGSDDVKDAVVKAGLDGAPRVFAAGFHDLRGLAFGPEGSLYAADSAAGQVLRFRPPPPPRLAEIPAYTNRPSVVIAGVTEPAARVDVVGHDGDGAVGESDGSGAFSLSMGLEPEAVNALHVRATPHRGAGLTSAPIALSIEHDSRPPQIEFARPSAGSVLRSIVGVEVSARDDGSGVAAIALAVDGVPLDAGAVAGTALWDTRRHADGWHTLSAVGVDRAGNRGTGSVVVLVDNTPPETSITRDAIVTAQTRSVVITFTGTDNVTPTDRLHFAWRVDGGAATESGPDTELTLRDLAPGDHVVEVWAIDQAGNEDPTPAAARFTMGTPAIAITAPGAGAVLPSGPVLVRGTIDPVGQEVGVTVNGVAAVVDGGAFAALVPVFPETAALTAVAATRGGTAADRVPISVTDEVALALDAAPASGLPPLTVTFSVRSSVGLAQIELDADGDGRADVTTDDPGMSFTYSQPGMYVPRIRAVDALGAVVSAAAVVHVQDAVAFEAARRHTWSALHDALERGDVGAALDAFVAASRSRYEPALTALIADLPRIASEMTELSLVSAEGGLAELATTRVQDGGPRLYLIYFVQAADGRWRILRM